MVKDTVIDLAKGLLRQNLVIDLAFELTETLSRETRVAGLCLGLVGFGAGLSACALLAAFLTAGHWAAWVALAVGLTFTAVAGYRLVVARRRITALRDAITAKAARDAAAAAAARSVELAKAGVGGVVQAGAVLGRHVGSAGAAAASAGKSAVSALQGLADRFGSRTSKSET